MVSRQKEIQPKNVLTLFVMEVIISNLNAVLKNWIFYILDKNIKKMY